MLFINMDNTIQKGGIIIILSLVSIVRCYVEHALYVKSTCCTELRVIRIF